MTAKPPRSAGIQTVLEAPGMPVRDPEETWASDDWQTPWPLVRELEAEFGPFDLDPCCTAATAKAPRFYTKADDGLSQPWSGRVFMNPPYSDIAPWLRKALESSGGGALVVSLLPVRTEMGWWHDLVWPYAEVRWIRGRQRHIGVDGTTIGRPVFASCIAVFRPRGTA